MDAVGLIERPALPATPSSKNGTKATSRPDSRANCPYKARNGGSVVLAEIGGAFHAGEHDAHVGGHEPA